MLRLALAVASAALAFGPGPAHATPFTLDDLLRLERFGQVAISPRESAVVFERIGPVLDAGAYEYDALGPVLRSSIFVIPTTADGAPRHLLGAAEGQGHVIGSWSPDDGRLLIYRLGGRTFSAGIVDAATGAVRWLEGTPETALWGRSAQWRNPDELVMILRPDQDLPTMMRMGFQPEERLTQLWEQTRQGEEAGRTVIGGGAYLRLNPKPADSRIVLISAATGETQALASGRFYDLEVAPGGRFVAAARFTDDRPFDPSAPFLQGEFTERRELTLVDLATGEVWEPIPGNDLAPHLLAWSPSGDRLLVWARSDGDPWSEGRLVQIEARRRTVVETQLGNLQPALVQTGLRMEIVSADWFGEDPVLYVQNGGRRDWALLSPAGPEILSSELSAPSSTLLAVSSERIVVQAEGDAWSVDRTGRAQRLGRATRSSVSMTSALFSQGQRFQFNNPVRRDWVLTEDANRRRRFPAASGTAFGTPFETNGQLAAGGETIAVSRTVDAHYRETLTLNDGRPLMRLNPGLSDIAFAEAEAVTHHGPDGAPLVSWLYRPPLTKVARPPLIVVPYPGGPARAPGPTDDAVMTNVQVMVAAGYAVLIPSLPRTERRGEPALGMASDILGSVDAAAATGGFDAERIILWGHSFGAFAAVAAATQSDRFVAVIAANGPYDLLSVWGQFPLGHSLTPADGLAVRSRAGWVETGQGGLGAPPFDDVDRYARNSPAFAAGRIAAPVLLFTGDRDYVPSGQAEELFSALYRQQKDVVLVTYRGEGHVLSSPANIRDMYETVWRWLDDVLTKPNDDL